MAVSEENLERGLDLLLDLVRENEAAQAEFDASRYDYFAGDPPRGPASDTNLAFRRHAEWFLLERPCSGLGGVPVDSLSALWMDRADHEGRDSYEALVSSQAGIFAVTGVEPGQGVWLRDLAGIGEYPLHEPHGSHALQEGDLLVGRIFPVGDSLYRISQAAAYFRNAELLRALEADLQRLRKTRRGVMRIEQSELERMFWGDRTWSQAGEPVADARALLIEAEVPTEAVERIFAQLSATPFQPAAPVLGSEDLLQTILDQLAFDTAIDLDAARRALLAAWPVLCQRAQAGHLNGHGTDDGPAGPGDPEEAPDVAAAVEAFDRGRAQGRDLDDLFDQLEAELDLADESSEPPQDSVPDFPGVVGAMIEEFLWDMERERGVAAARDLQILRRFGSYATDVGVFENLGRRDLLFFTTLWLPEKGGLTNADQARRMLAAMRAFCRWSEDLHCVPLLSEFRNALRGIEDSLPRIVEANRRRDRQRKGPGTGALYEFTGLDAEQSAILRDLHEREHLAPLDPELTGWLRPGDRLRGERCHDGSWIVYCCYPPESRELTADV